MACPSAAAELGKPVIGRAAAWRRVTPNIPIALRVVARGAAFGKPGMSVRCMVWHKIEDQLEAIAVHGGEQAINHAVHVPKVVNHRSAFVWKSAIDLHDNGSIPAPSTHFSSQ